MATAFDIIKQIGRLDISRWEVELNELIGGEE
jgi:hypothetical protein